MATVAKKQPQPIRSTIPARLDRLRWSPFHTRLVLGLGTAWVLDGLSVTIASAVTSKLTQPDTLDLTTTQAASIGTVYLVGEMIGALVFGRMSDSLGRHKLFTWTLAVYLVGPALAFVIVFVRRNLPESPRWLITHGREQEAEEAIRRIEEAAIRDGQHLEPVPANSAITIMPEKRYGYLTLLRLAFRHYPKRAFLGATLMITQSFLHNAIFFTYALVLTKFYHVSNNAVPLYGLAFAVGNLAWLFAAGVLQAAGQTFIWIVIFFFASAGASAGYLTVSEIFPIEIRAGIRHASDGNDLIRHMGNHAYFGPGVKAEVADRFTDQFARASRLK